MFWSQTILSAKSQKSLKANFTGTIPNSVKVGDKDQVVRKDYLFSCICYFGSFPSTLGKKFPSIFDVPESFVHVSMSHVVCECVCWAAKVSVGVTLGLL